MAASRNIVPLIDKLSAYLDPSFEAMIRCQLRFAEEGYEKLSGVQRWVDLLHCSRLPTPYVSILGLLEFEKIKGLTRQGTLPTTSGTTTQMVL